MPRLNRIPTPWEGSGSFPRPPRAVDLRFAVAAVIGAAYLFEPNTAMAVVLGSFVFQSLGGTRGS